jgi:hypothetical protein
MTRADKIRAELLARLELERFTLPPTTEPTADNLRGWTPEEQAEHRAILADALSGDETVIAWRERGAA